MTEDEARDPRERIGRAKYERVLGVLDEVAAVQAAGNFGIVAGIVRTYDQGPTTRFNARLEA